MTAYGPPAGFRPPASPVQRGALLHYVAGGLGVLSFIWGFLTWFKEERVFGNIGGYALLSPAVAIVGFSLAAGLLAAAGTWEKKQASLTPAVLALTGLLLAVGVLIGKGNIGSGANTAKLGVGIGLILELITVIVQVGVLVFAWMSASGRIAAPAPAAPAWQQPPQQQPYPGQPQPQPQPGPPGGYGPPHTYGPGQAPPPPGPQQGYGPPPPHNPGYRPPPPGR